MLRGDDGGRNARFVDAVSSHDLATHPFAQWAQAFLSINAGGRVSGILGGVIFTVVILILLTLLVTTDPGSDKSPPPGTNVFIP